MKRKALWVLLIFASMFVGTAQSGYSFGSADLINSSGSNNINGLPTDNGTVRSAMMKLPISFIENRGPTSNEAKFMVKASQATIYFTPSEVLFALVSKNNSSNVRMSFEGANPERLVGEEPLPGKANFFTGNNSSQWLTDIPIYASVRYQGIYPGIDLVFKGTEGNLKHELVLDPGADPAAIVFLYNGQDNISLNNNGSLLIRTEAGYITDSAPICYQDIDGRRVDVEGEYRKIDENRIGFEVKDYNRSLPLMIDPCLVYSTYLGGSSRDGDHGGSIAIDASGNAYVTGSTSSNDFPTTTSAYNTTFGGDYDAFVTKLSPEGNALVYSTYLGGSSGDEGLGIAVDSQGNAYVAGLTDSTDFPTKNAYYTAINGTFDAFVTKLSPEGNALVYSTYLGRQQWR